jgi:hypothetical protein
MLFASALVVVGHLEESALRTVPVLVGAAEQQQSNVFEPQS